MISLGTMSHNPLHTGFHFICSKVIRQLQLLLLPFFSLQFPELYEDCLQIAGTACHVMFVRAGAFRYQTGSTKRHEDFTLFQGYDNLTINGGVVLLCNMNTSILRAQRPHQMLHIVGRSYMHAKRFATGAWPTACVKYHWCCANQLSDLQT
jgi:hypothetical protein